MALKLAATTLGCPDWSIEKIAAFWAECGVEGLEVRGIEREMDNAKIPCFTEEAFPETKRLLDANGVRLMCLGTSARFHTDELLAEGVAEAKAAVDVAARLGAGAIRVFGNDLTGDPAEDEKVFARLAAGLREVCDYVGDRDVKVCLETHGDFNNLERMGKVLDSMRDVPQFGIIWDVMHTVRVHGADFEEMYTLLKPRLHHLHIKDYREPVELVLCGEGVVPLKEITARLKADGFDGYLSLEWEKMWHPEIADMDTALPQFAAYFKALL